jgi:co-chaperonin GroES (HSP10)
MIPLRTNILIEPFEHKSEVFTVSDKLTIEKAKVISVGIDVQVIAPGDNIIYKSYSPDVVEIDGKEFTFIKEEDVIALS